jgi:voltage-gated potassium channel
MPRTFVQYTPRLFVKSDRSPERVLLNRLALLLALVCLALTVFWMERDGLRDQLDGHVSFRDVVYFTAITLTTVGYGDIVPVSPQARLLDAVLVTPLRLAVWLIFLGTAYELVLQRWLENRRMNRLEKTLAGHLIICGFGHSGQAAAHESVERGIPAGQILVMDRDAERLRQAAEAGCIGLLGDPTREKDLEAARIGAARAMLVCLGRDDAAVLAVLTARQMSPRVRIVCNVAEEENIKLIQQAGADAIVAPSLVGGYLMADSVETSHIADYVSDLMRASGRVRLRQRPARAGEIGRAMRELEPGFVVRLIRGTERVGFWEGDRARVREGDVLLVIEPGNDAPPATAPPTGG